jgi:hypothetical protein
MTTNTPHDLLSVVDRLTLPKFEHVAQMINDTWKVRSVEVPPLLELFRDAVKPSSNNSAGSAAMKSTRSLIDGDALLEYSKMVATSAGWAHDAGSTPTRDPIVDLRAWYAATLADNARDDDWYRRHLNGWVGIITTHLEPPGRFTIHRPCPVCRGTSYGDQITGGDLWPIEVRYRVDDEGRTSGHTATCRIPGCGTRWLGHDAVMELAEELAEGAA